VVSRIRHRPLKRAYTRLFGYKVGAVFQLVNIALSFLAGISSFGSPDYYLPTAKERYPFLKP